MQLGIRRVAIIIQQDIRTRIRDAQRRGTGDADRLIVGIGD